ncbi:hypothetical protein F8388_021806 [Cannabis sativa]|uniref:AP2/ERF domain-containing protein n=1 Tax=Cannabis sativa TaxID=3483 RepID=A0A7J6E2I8_CANSA|nr:hypothetical protein F8388_021806 [Cannabis sativa]KAF4384057.1 hypothetical protein G4B88_030953 [Cannabis sativa]
MNNFSTTTEDYHHYSPSSSSSSSASSSSSSSIHKDYVSTKNLNINSSVLLPPNNSNNFTKKSLLQEKRKSGRKKFKETRHPIYRGVRQRKGKWVCELRQPHIKNSRLWLGTFSSPDMAARAYDVAALAIKGESASLNFPQDKTTYQKNIDYSTTASSSGMAAAPVAVVVTDPTSTISSNSTREPPSSSSVTVAQVQSQTQDQGPGLGLLTNNNSSSNVDEYLDEEEVFNMPGLLDSLAEGLILTPPAMKKGFSWDDYNNNGFNDYSSNDHNFSLWSE